MNRCASNLSASKQAMVSRFFTRKTCYGTHGDIVDTILDGCDGGIPTFKRPNRYTSNLGIYFIAKLEKRIAQYSIGINGERKKFSQNALHKNRNHIIQRQNRQLSRELQTHI